MKNKRYFQISMVFNVPPGTLYNAWLNGDLHSQMTGGEAVSEEKLGAHFTAWDRYISGRNLELEKNRKVVQSWRTTAFRDTDEDSKITLTFEQLDQGTKLTLFHENIPEGQADYEQGWKDYYFKPMTDYFGR